MKKDYETMLRDLFNIYYQECPNHRILYALYDEKKDQAHIVLDNTIEIIAFNNYQGAYAIKFALSIDCEEYYFNNYKDASTYEL